MAKDTLQVFANPWLHIDSSGRACCAVERIESPRRWVGASPVVTAIGEAVTVGSLSGYVGGEAQHDVEWKFDEEPQTVENNAYYRMQIKDGALVLVDSADASRLGLSVKTGKVALAKVPQSAPEKPAQGKKGSE